MKHKQAALTLLLALLLLLCSCQLAVPDGDGISGSDRLIGVFVTGEHLDLWDFEAYFEENAEKIINGSGEVSAEDSQKYKERIFATPVFTEDGMIDHYTFKNLDGAGLYFFEQTAQNGETQALAYCDPGYMTDAQYRDSQSADGTDVSIEATVHLAIHTNADGLYAQFYANPVYQSADGSVYLTAGQGSSYGGDALSGSVGSVYLNESSTQTTGDTAASQSSSVTVHAMIKPETASVTMTEMDAADAPVSQRSFAPAQLRDGVTASGEYLVITYETSGEDEPERHIVNRGDESFPIYIASGEWLCQVMHVALDWR